MESSSIRLLLVDASSDDHTPCSPPLYRCLFYQILPVSLRTEACMLSKKEVLSCSGLLTTSTHTVGSPRSPVGSSTLAWGGSSAWLLRSSAPRSCKIHREDGWKIHREDGWKLHRADGWKSQVASQKMDGAVGNSLTHTLLSNLYPHAGIMYALF